MSDNSGIEWTDATWNPVTGCSKVSQGCKHCYAERDWARLSKIGGNVYTGRAFTDVRCHSERLDQPLRWAKPRRIFVNSMSDLFHEAVPFEFIKQVWDVIARRLDHNFQILTKRPERLLEFHRWLAGGDDISITEWPRNAWIGVSIENQDTADERIPLLLEAPAAVRWISAEPLLGPVNLRLVAARGPWTGYVDALSGYRTKFEGAGCTSRPGERIDWVVVGGESGPKARPVHPDWVRSLRDQCRAARASFFFKQWGEWIECETDVLPEPGGNLVYPIDESIELIPGRPYRTDAAHGAEFVRVGKRTAGRMLDGRTWEEYPSCS